MLFVLFVCCCLLYEVCSSVSCLLFVVVSCSLPVLFCVLFVVCRFLLVVVCCLLFGVRCLVFVVW